MWEGVTVKNTVYNRAAAVAYARKWAYGRNPAYYNFDSLGGDCTNFISQCIYAGAGQMNYTPDVGWYYISVSNRAAAWTGVRFLYNFLISNDSLGPYAREVTGKEIQTGDVIQLGREDGSFYHSLMVTATSPAILVAAHTNDTLDKPLHEYYFDRARFLHIEGIRKE